MEVKELEFKMPWIGGVIKIKIPVTTKSAATIITFICISVMITLTMCSFLIFVKGNTENIDGVADFFGRKPLREKSFGMEITSCPPCPLCEEIELPTQIDKLTR